MSPVMTIVRAAGVCARCAVLAGAALLALGAADRSVAQQDPAQPEASPQQEPVQQGDPQQAAPPQAAPAQAAQPEPAQPPQDAAPALSMAEIDQLVAPIALYPDNLLGQVLTASTYPLEVVMAARWRSANPDAKGQQLEDAMQAQPWDPSVKALAAVPQVLQMMNDKLDWTKQLGEAYLAQPDDIAASVQRLRARADASGSLKSSSQLKVKRVPPPPPPEGVTVVAPPPEYIVIESVEPDIVYVPVYDPWVVYGAWPYPAYRPFYWYPPGYAAVGVIGFGAPIVVGAALWARYNWYSRRVDVDVYRYNRFNRVSLTNSVVNRTWRYNPAHRGGIAYSNPVLQQRFGRTGTANINRGPNNGSRPQQLFNAKGGAGQVRGGIGANTVRSGIGANTKSGPDPKRGIANLTPNTPHLNPKGNPRPQELKKLDRGVNTNRTLNVPSGRNLNIPSNTQRNANINRNAIVNRNATNSRTFSATPKPPMAKPNMAPRPVVNARPHPAGNQKRPGQH